MGTITQVLRDSMRRSGDSLYRIAKESGLKYTAIHGFYHGKRDLYLASADKLARYLEVEVNPPKSDRRRDAVRRKKGDET